MKTKTRLYVEDDLALGKEVKIIAPQIHFLKNVMRCNVDDNIALFNGKDGEFIAKIIGIKNKAIISLCVEKIREQTQSENVKLYFGSTNKHRLAFLVEKACELGVTELQPITTEFGNKSLFSVDKMRLQVIEAAEQCERLDVPVVHDIIKLENITDENVIIFADESKLGKPLKEVLNIVKGNPVSVLIGPAGGFSDREKKIIQSWENVVNTSLGNNILRVETAGIMILSGLLINH